MIRYHKGYFVPQANYSANTNNRLFSSSDTHRDGNKMLYCRRSDANNVRMQTVLCWLIHSNCIYVGVIAPAITLLSMRISYWGVNGDRRLVYRNEWGEKHSTHPNTSELSSDSQSDCTWDGTITASTSSWANIRLINQSINQSNRHRFILLFNRDFSRPPFGYAKTVSYAITVSDDFLQWWSFYSFFCAAQEWHNGFKLHAGVCNLDRFHAGILCQSLIALSD